MKQVRHRLIAKIRSMGLRRTLGYVLFTVLLERLGLHVNVVFLRAMNGAPSEPDPAGFHVDVVQHEEGISEQDAVALREYGGGLLMDSFHRAFAAGKRCVILRSGNSGIATICWIEKVSGFPPASDAPCVLVSRCFTLPQYRGMGLYPALLRMIDGVLPAEMRGLRHAVIECSFFNYASRRGIVKAGFKQCGIAVEISRKRLVWRRD